MIMMKRETIPIADVYVPIKRRATLEQKRVNELAASILDKGLLAPILVRADGARFVLVGVCTGWRPPKRLAKRPLSPSLSMHGSTKRLSAALAHMPHSRHANDHTDRAKHCDTRAPGRHPPHRRPSTIANISGTIRDVIVQDQLKDCSSVVLWHFRDLVAYAPNNGHVSEAAKPTLLTRTGRFVASIDNLP
jgi:hypothetical protein